MGVVAAVTVVAAAKAVLLELLSFENALSRYSRFGGVTGVEHGTCRDVADDDDDVFVEGHSYQNENVLSVL